LPTNDLSQPKQLQLTKFARPVPGDYQEAVDMAPARYGPRDMEEHVQFADFRGGGSKMATMPVVVYNKACREWNLLLKRFNERGQLISHHEGLMSKQKHDMSEAERELFALRAEEDDWAQLAAQWKIKETEFAAMQTRLALAEKEANNERERAEAMVEIVKAREEAHSDRCRELQAAIVQLKASDDDSDKNKSTPRTLVNAIVSKTETQIVRPKPCASKDPALRSFPALVPEIISTGKLPCTGHSNVSRFANTCRR